MKALVIVGTRPEAIKLAPVIFALQEHLEVSICSTGQHKEMLSQALTVFGISPDIQLDIMTPNQSLNGLASSLVAELDEVLEREKPDWVIVQGDTTSAFCAGLASFHREIKVAHVEAGLRTDDLASPFPEEANRRLLSQIASLHFAPTYRAQQALIAEGINAEKVVITGNTIVDAVDWVVSNILNKQFPLDFPDLEGQLEGGPLVLVTCHRREHFGRQLEEICGVIEKLCKKYQEYRWIFPVHLNPNVREPVNTLLRGVENLTLTAPLTYPATLSLLKKSTLVLTDSGGIQEEAPSFGVPVVIMRLHTERSEGVEAGFATLAGTEARDIQTAVSEWLDHPERRQALKDRRNPYGDGQASERVSAALTQRPFTSFDG